MRKFDPIPALLVLSGVASVLLSFWVLTQSIAFAR